KDRPSTLEQLSQKYSISRERVRQIEVRAFEKLQKAMHKAMQSQQVDHREALDAM
ncbi:MAG: RNA polymerase factor sigma-32, partial [Parvibaculaceae bacterium]|nr:RNA polymerase factor sigma-32 [Parvibaculaceae bacterium]